MARYLYNERDKIIEVCKEKPKRCKRENAEYPEDLGEVIDGIPTLQTDLCKQLIKGVLGRNKIKNPYGEWSKKTAETLDASSAKFQLQKDALPAAMTLG